jgi:Flp pilus assembly pilin Flp
MPVSQKPRAKLDPRNEAGLSRVEYVIIAVLIAAIAVGAWKTFGENVDGDMAGGTSKRDTGIAAGAGESAP